MTSRSLGRRISGRRRLLVRAFRVRPVVREWPVQVMLTVHGVMGSFLILPGVTRHMLLNAYDDRGRPVAVTVGIQARLS